MAGGVKYDISRHGSTGISNLWIQEDSDGGGDGGGDGGDNDTDSGSDMPGDVSRH